VDIQSGGTLASAKRPFAWLESGTINPRRPSNFDSTADAISVVIRDRATVSYSRGNGYESRAELIADTEALLTWFDRRLVALDPRTGQVRIDTLQQAPFNDAQCREVRVGAYDLDQEAQKNIAAEAERRWAALKASGNPLFQLSPAPPFRSISDEVAALHAKLAADARNAALPSSVVPSEDDIASHEYFAGMVARIKDDKGEESARQATREKPAADLAARIATCNGVDSVVRSDDHATIMASDTRANSMIA
jgi:hypothetical protein